MAYFRILVSAVLSKLHIFFANYKVSDGVSTGYLLVRFISWLSTYFYPEKYLYKNVDTDAPTLYCAVFLIFFALLHPNLSTTYALSPNTSRETILIKQHSLYV